MTRQMKPNAELVYRALDTARATNALNMRAWVRGPFGAIGLEELTAEGCGTTACLAGWVAALEGYKVDTFGYAYEGNGRIAGSVSTIARRLLGLDLMQSGKLFFAYDYELDDRIVEIFGPRLDGAR